MSARLGKEDQIKPAKGDSSKLTAMIQITKDTVSNAGRSIEVSILKTDNEIFNNKVKLPIYIYKTFAIETPIEKIKEWAITEAQDRVKYDFKRITSPKSLVGTSLEVKI